MGLAGCEHPEELEGPIPAVGYKWNGGEELVDRSDRQSLCRALEEESSAALRHQLPPLPLPDRRRSAEPSLTELPVTAAGHSIESETMLDSSVVCV